MVSGTGGKTSALEGGEGPRCGRVGRGHAQLARNPAADVGLRGHCPDEQAAAARPIQAEASAGGGAGVLLGFPGHAGFVGVEKSGALFGLDCGIGPAAARKPGVECECGLSGVGENGEGHDHPGGGGLV